MKTRLRFKIIAVLICLSLAGLLISQGYWLKGLYVSSKKSTWDNIEEAMRMADYMELFLRLDSLSNNNFHSQINPQFSFSQDTAWEKRKDSLSTDNMPISSPNSTIQYIEAAQTLNEYLQIIGTLERNVQMLMHQKIDTLLPRQLRTIQYTIKERIKETGHHRPVPPAGNPERSERLRIICLYGCFRKRGILERRCPLHTCDRTGILLRIGTPIS